MATGSTRDSLDYYALQMDSKMCPICVEREVEIEVMCGHGYCGDCLREYAKQESWKKEVMRCPRHDCRGEIPLQDVKRLLVGPDLLRYLRFQDELRLERKQGFRWCPQPGCTGYALADSSTSTLQCTHCGHLFCSLCLHSHTPGSACTGQDSGLRLWVQRSKAKFCPNCKTVIQRGAGCSQMMCARCRHRWCWLCGLPLAQHSECPVQRLWIYNPPYAICLALLFAPVLLPFAFIILAVLLAAAGFENNWIDALRERHPWLFYTLLTTTAAVLTPIFVLVVLFSGGVVLGEYCWGQHTRKCMWGVFVAICSVLGAPVTLGSVILLAILAPCAGAGYLLFKIYIWQRRIRGDTDYLQPTGLQGYPIG